MNGIKDIAGWDAERQLAFGYAGWLLLKYYRHETERRQNRTIRVSLHHGFVGGKLKGAKGLNMQRWLWSHECDIAFFNHSHNADIFTEAVRGVDHNGNLWRKVRYGGYGGTYLQDIIKDTSTYSEVKGYFPLATGGICVTLKPHAVLPEDRIKLETRGLS